VSTLDAQRLFAPEPHDEPIVLRNRTLRPGTDPAALSRFSDHVWQLTPAHPDAHVTVPALRWTRFPHELVDLFKTFVLAALDHPYPTGPGHHRPGARPSVATFHYWILDLLTLATWMHSQGMSRLCDMTDDDLDRYHAHVLALARPARRKADLLAIVRTIWLYRPHLPADGRLRTAYPWGSATGKELVHLPTSGPDNKTPRIDPATMDALLAWSLRMIEDIGPDIVAARSEYQQLDDGVHPDQAEYAGLSRAERLAALLDHARRTGAPLPASPARPGKVNHGHVQRLIGILPADRGGLSRRQHHLLDTCGLPLSTATPIGSITGQLNGHPWRAQPINVEELPTLTRALSAAAFVVVCYLSGMRPGEVLNLHRGCRATDPVTGELQVYGRPGKGYDRAPDGATLATADGQRPWTVVAPVHAAIAILEDLHPHELLFPAGLTVMRHDRRPGGTHARQTNTVTRDLDAFVTWVNTTFTAQHGTVPIPADPTKHLHAARFRRTLAHFIVRRPRGLIAAALQYGHASTRVTMSYAGRADTSWMDDLAIERLELILEQHEHDSRRLDDAEHVSGPAAGDYRARVAAGAQFLGRVVTSRRSVARLLNDVDQDIHHGEAMTCVWRPETAACRTARIEQGLPSNDTPTETECRSGCANLAYTDRDIAALRIQHTQSHLAAGDTLAPQPLRDRHRELADRTLLIIRRHNSSRPPTSGNGS
jgi:integrase